MDALSKIQNAEVPSFLKPSQDAVADGFLDDESGMIEIPRLKILQGISGEVQDGVGKPGEFFSNKMSRPLGKTITVSPIAIDIEWVKFNDEMKVEWRTSDPNDPRVTGDDQSWRYKSYNMLCLLETDENGEDIRKDESEAPNIAMYTARSTGTVEMREFYQLAKRIYNSKGAALYGQRYQLGTWQKKTKKGQHFALSFDFIGFQEDAEVYSMLQMIREGFIGKGTTADYGGDSYVHESAPDNNEEVFD